MIDVGIHGLLTFTLARAFRLDAETTAVASQAAVGGPSTAMALATSRGWGDLALPGLLVGLLGYTVGNYAGLAIAYLTRAMLGGLRRVYCGALLCVGVTAIFAARCNEDIST